jgi:hypothetical protein
MNRQFPNRSDVNNSEEALKKLVDLIMENKDDRLPMWAAEWAVEKCKEKIVKCQSEIIRCERFDYTEDVARKQRALSEYESVLALLIALQDYIRLTLVEGGGVLPKPRRNSK